MKNKIITIIGTRPEIIKMFPVIKLLDKHFDNYLIWSGQHYDYSMVKNIFADVELRKPNINLKIKKNLLPFFEIQKKIYKLINKLKPKAIIYHGDTFTTLASALVSRFFFEKIQNIHIEGGYRSYDKLQIEEQIRFISDHLSKINFVQRKIDKKTIEKEFPSKNVFAVGNSINDSVNQTLERLKKNKIIDKSNINKGEYIYCTIHRAENTNNKKRFDRIIKVIKYFSVNFKVIIPVHPRVKKKESFLKSTFNSNVILTEPLPYSDSLYLLNNCLFCFTDSGGIQEEAVILRKKCLIPLNFTPHNYYLTENSNKILKIESNNYLFHAKKFLLNSKNKKMKIFYHKKDVSKNIIKHLNRIL